MRILVTGLCGFTGHYLKKELEAHGHVVMGLTSDLTDAQGVLEEIERKQPEAVLHLAGIAFVGHGMPEDFYTVNVIGTRHLLAALASKAPKVKAVILASSASIYGQAARQPIDEQTRPQPQSDYAVSKLAMEAMARLWQDRLPLCIVRPFNYTGVGQSTQFLIPKIVAHFRKKDTVIALGNLKVSREFGDVRGVAEIYRRLVLSNSAGCTFNVCTGAAYALEEVLALCAEITGQEIAVEVNPAFVRAQDAPLLVGDNSLLQQAIGDWQSINLKNTLTWMLGAPES